MGPAPALAQVRSAVRAALRADELRADEPCADELYAGELRADGGCDGVLVACSGGADSLALAAAAAFEAPRRGIRAGMVTVDHGLQPGSAEQARRVADIGHGLGLSPIEIVRVQVGAAGGPEGAARTARYAALSAAGVAHRAKVLLGHTLDDQAETVLLGLGRGSGPRSIAGMAVHDGRWVRPLLALRRSLTRAACLAAGLTPWDDPHNDDPAYTRVRLRAEVLPLLEDVLHGGVAPALARTAELLRDDLAALDDWAARIHPGALDPDGGLRIDALQGLPRAVRTRVLRRWAAAVGAQPLPAERTAALDALVTAWHGQDVIDLPGGVAVRRLSGTLVAVSSVNEQRQE